MGINIFVVSIIVISLILTNIKMEKTLETQTDNNVPLVVFENSIMYDIDEKEIKQIVQSRQALNYKNRDELYDATILIRNKDNSSDTISAEYIFKQGNLYKLYQNVNLIQSDKTQLITDYLKYDSLTKIAQNNIDFTLRYNGNTLVGNNLYFDGINHIIKAKDTHFMITQ
jgi:hypothetical protein